MDQQLIAWISLQLGALQCGPGGQWPTQNFGWVGHNAFGPANNWPLCSLILRGLLLRKISKIGAVRCQILMAKRDQIRFPLGLRPKPQCEFTALPQTSSCI